MKHLRQTVKHTEHNSLIKRNIKEIIKQGKKAVTAGTIDKQAGELTHKLQKTADKAVKSGVLKLNTANRKKSRFAEMIKKAGVKANATKPKTEVKAEVKK